MTTANEALFDALVRHQVDLLRYSRSVQDRVIRLLDRTEPEIVEKILGRLVKAPGGLTAPSEVRRLNALLKIINGIRSRAFEQVTDAWVEEMIDLAKAEPAALSAMVATTAPVIVQTVAPGANFLRSIVYSQPFQGRIMRDWARKLESEDRARIHDAIRRGMVEGDTPAQIARRVVGTARLKGADGMTAITRRNAEAITRTGVNHIANHARSAWLQENGDLFEFEVYVATLDARTTPICRSLDGDRYPVGKGPHPPMHWNCRSLRVALLDDELMGNRPAKPTTERQLLREFAAREGFKAPTKRAGLPYGAKGDYDLFARGRIRELTGPIPAKVTYQEWLTRLPAAIQDDILGPTRGRLFRSGGLDLKKFTHRNGDQLPLSELANRQAAAFKAAGLDPEAY